MLWMNKKLITVNCLYGIFIFGGRGQIFLKIYFSHSMWENHTSGLKSRGHYVGAINWPLATWGHQKRSLEDYTNKDLFLAQINLLPTWFKSAQSNTDLVLFNLDGYQSDLLGGTLVKYWCDLKMQMVILQLFSSSFTIVFQPYYS